MKKIIFLLLTFISLNSFAALDNNSIYLEVPLEKPMVENFTDITYFQGTSAVNTPVKLNLDILQPVEAKKKKLPLVVFVKGGGFVSVLKERYLQQRLKIAEAGYIVASVEYRTIPNGIFPQPLEDIKAAIRFLKKNADKYGIDKDKVAIMGDSSGGYMASMVGVTNGIRKFDVGENLDENSDVNAVIDIYGLSDLTRIGEGYSEDVKKSHMSDSAPEAILINGLSVFGTGGNITSNLNKTKEANPITYITKNTPPFLLFHGDKDTLVSIHQTEILHKALREKGIDSTRYVVKNAAHGGEYWVQPKIMEIVIDFLNKNLKEKKVEEGKI